MTYSDYTTQSRDYEYRIGQLQETLAKIAELPASEITEERREFWLKLYGEQCYQLKTDAAVLTKSYYGTTATDTFFKH